MELIDGRRMARAVLDEIKDDVEKLDFQPVFCDVLVGEDSVSEQYVRMKERRAMSVGLGVHTAHFSSNITTDELVTEIQAINKMPHMCGLIVQLPLPEHIDTEKVLDAIDSNIDVDVLGQENTQLFYEAEPRFVYPTAGAILHMLDSLEIDLTDKKFVVVGQGRLVGRPMTHLLKKRGYNVATIDKDTEDAQSLTQDADIIISATGIDALITGDKIQEGAILVDAGTSEEDGNIVGDISLHSVRDKARLVSPVPGGVGPLTIAMLFKNVLLAAKNKN